MTHTYDIIIFGGGIAGLFLANRLQQIGYNLIVIEKDKLGGQQTLASQGMIHGGQKYALGKGSGHVDTIAAMPAKWDACFEGHGDIDLFGVQFLSDHQLMFPAGSFWSRLSTYAAALAVRGRTALMPKEALPHVLQRGPVYGMDEKVVETKSLIQALTKNLEGRIFKGEAQEVLPDGQVAVDGVIMKAEVVIFTAGIGNETALKLLRVPEMRAQRRPLRQVMVRPMDEPLYGHGVVSAPKPRVTVTSHPMDNGHYVWYLGGNVAEKGAKMSEEETLQFAKKEMAEIFPDIAWDKKEWATLEIDRAEAFDASGQLPPGPVVQQRGRILIAWPTKLTFAPALADNVIAWLHKSDIRPGSSTELPPLPHAKMGKYPWEMAKWRHL